MQSAGDTPELAAPTLANALPAGLVEDDEVVILLLRPSILYILLASLGSLLVIAVVTLALMYLGRLVGTPALCNPKSIRACVLLRKHRPTAMQTPCEYVGFDIPDEFVVGYGLDYQSYYRNLPDVCTFKGDAS